MKEKQAMCSNPECFIDVKWVRCTQFAGDHFFCEYCAEKEEDFGQEGDSYFFWVPYEKFKETM